MTNYSFYKHRWIYISVAIVVILAGIVSFFVSGLNIDIDFKGGTSIVFNTMSDSATKEEIEQLVRDNVDVKGSVVVQPSMEKPTEYTVKMQSLSTEESDKVINALKEKYVPSEENFDDYSISSFTAAYGKQLAGEAVWAVVIALLLMLVYITFRFEFLQGVCAVIGLLHDTLIMLAVYTVFMVPVNSSFIAVILTILGYSINNTIVVFDRVRENKKFARKETTEEIVDKSLNGTLMRSINTTITTLIMVVCLYIFGGTSIKEFSFPLMIGLIGGAYSSLFIVAPVWAMMKGGNKPTQAKKSK